MFKEICEFVAAAILVVAICLLASCSKGIVTVEGWAHGVAFCESEFSSVLYIGDPTVKNDGVATYVINKGHWLDPQHRTLVKKAAEYCAQFDN